jgi:hypothetical protein
MFVADLRHFLDIPHEAPGPARKMAEHLGFVVRAATAGEAGTSWVTALTCRRRPANRPCAGQIAVFRADLPAPIEWRCTACGDEGVISGWEDSLYDLRQPRSSSDEEPRHETLLTDGLAATLRELMFLDMECERLVFQIHSSSEGIVLTASAEELDELLGFIAANANHETNRRRQKRLDAAFDVLTEALQTVESADTFTAVVAIAEQAKEVHRDTADLTGRWRILEMDLWDREALDLVAPAFIEFSPDHTGEFGFIAVTGWIDWRSAGTGRSGVEFSWEGADEGDRVSGRGSAAIQNDGLLHGHLYFHLGDDSGFRAERTLPWRGVIVSS